MGWIKISDEDGGIYAKEPENDPEQIVSVAEIEAEIKELQARIDNIRFIKVPVGVNEEVVEAIDFYNQQNALGDKIMLDTLLGSKTKLLAELKAS